MGEDVFRENLDCLRDAAAKVLVLQVSAAARGRALPAVRTAIDRGFNCQHPVARNSTHVLSEALVSSGAAWGRQRPDAEGSATPMRPTCARPVLA